MCGRFAINDRTNALIEELVEEHGITVLRSLSDYLPAFNIKPTHDVPTILHSKKRGEDVLTSSRWSLLPSWSKEPKLKYPTFNARTEGITEKASWKGPVKQSRCLIPASGYYEWVGDKAPKTPHWIHPDDELLMFAGLYSWWVDTSRPQDDESRWILTSTILTMPTVPELASIHDRNPVALPEALWWDWINPELIGDQTLIDHAVSASRSVMSELSEYVVRPLKGDGPELIEPA